MSWDQLLWYGAVAAACWIAGAVAAYRARRPWGAVAVSLCGSAVFLAFIIGMWVSLERPPMRTMGETRLWYSFFMALSGLLTYIRWR